MTRSVFLLLLLFTSPLFSQNSDYARSIVNELASEKFQGRGYTNHSDLKSAKYIREEYKRYNILPVNGKYFLPFKIDVNTFPGKMEVTVNDRKLTAGVNFIVDPASAGLSGIFEIIKTNRTDILDMEKYNLLVKSIAGKAVLINLNDTLKLSKEENDLFNKRLASIKYDPALKNKLTIIYSDKKLTWSISEVQALKAVINMSSNGLDADNISEIFVNIEVSLKRNYTTQNLIGIIPGKSKPDSFLVMTAHYDHLGIMGKGNIFPGANDNASGVAMLLNMGRYFSLHPSDYSIILIALSAEELGLVGASAFADHPVIDLKKIRFLVNFDLAGTGDDGIKVVNATIFNKEFEKLKELNEINQYMASVQSRGEACISDHCMFYRKDVPCFYIYTLGGVTYYHDIFDKAETLPFTDFDDYLKLMIAFFESF